METFRALMLKKDDGRFQAAFEDVPRESLPPGDVVIAVEYSSLNYKDGLAVTGKPGVVRKWPMVPGIDLAGTVESSQSPDFKAGDRVVVTGCGTSEVMWGGYSRLASVPAQVVVPLPQAYSTKQAMGIGTAGFTAMQAIVTLEAFGMTREREVVVTGAAGGVGSVAVALLSRLGYRAVASTGRPQEHDYLRKLGASDIIERSVLAAASQRPLESERWGGAIDNAGGETLAGLLRTMASNCSVASCGLAGGFKLETTVMPFILRGVNLLGINSVNLPQEVRRTIWARLASDLPVDLLDSMIRVEPLSRVQELGEQILAGQVRGRVVIDVQA